MGTAPMLRRTFAVLLMILLVLPFTAPFPAFHLSGSGQSHSTSVDDGSSTLPTLTASTRLRTLLISHLDAALSAHDLASPAGYAPRTAPDSSGLPAPPSLSVLRI